MILIESRALHEMMSAKMFKKIHEDVESRSQYIEIAQIYSRLSKWKKYIKK